MGGYGSGRSGVRPVAEPSYALRIGLVAPHLSRLAPGGFLMGQSLAWRWPNGDIAVALRYTVSCADSGLRTVYLAYATRDRTVTDPIGVVNCHAAAPSPRHSSCPSRGAAGRRCPGCSRRVGVLYRPPGASYWRCRHCYQITYASSNQAHWPARLELRTVRLLERAERLLGRGRR